MSLNKILILTAAVVFACLLLPAGSSAQNCAPISKSIHQSCSELGDGYRKTDSCGKLVEGYMCCCPPTPISKFSPKTIIIFSLVGVFAILTLGILIFRKNDQA